MKRFKASVRVVAGQGELAFTRSDVRPTGHHNPAARIDGYRIDSFGPCEKEIREDFLGTLKRIGWALGIAAIVATAGGFLTVSDLITIRIEEAIQDLDGIREISSNSSEGNSQVTVEVSDGFDVNEMLDEIKNRVDKK